MSQVLRRLITGAISKENTRREAVKSEVNTSTVVPRKEPASELNQTTAEYVEDTDKKKSWFPIEFGLGF